MNRISLFLAVALPALVQAAPHQKYFATMTGERLARYYLGDVGYANREMARGYMDAIKDATEGKEWCFVGVKPDEMNEDISLAIRKLPPAEQQDNAAKLVVATLHRLYPCNGGAR